MNNVRLIFKGVSEILGDEELCLLILTDVLETRQIGVVCDSYTQQQFGFRLTHPHKASQLLPEVLCSMLGRHDDESYEILITDIVNGQYTAIIRDRFSNFSKPINVCEGVLLSVISYIPLFIDGRLMVRQSIPFAPDSQRLSIPVNSISDSMLRHAMKRAVDNENYELASHLRDEINRRKENRSEE